MDFYSHLCRSLLFFLRPLVHQDHEGINKGDGDNLPAILAIFRTIKKAEDALAGRKTNVRCFNFNLLFVPIDRSLRCVTNSAVLVLVDVFVYIPSR